MTKQASGWITYNRKHMKISVIIMMMAEKSVVWMVLPHLQGNIEIGRHKDRNAEVGNTKHRIY